MEVMQICVGIENVCKSCDLVTEQVYEVEAKQYFREKTGKT